MEFNVKGITFTLEELTTIKLSEIKVATISRSHIFHMLPGNKKAILLLRAGDFVEPSFVSKYMDKGVESFYQLEVLQEEDIIFFKSHWSKLKEASSEYEKRVIRDNFIKQIATDYWFNKEKSVLSLVVSCFEEFYIYPPHILEKYQELSMVLYTRSLLIGAISSVAALSNDLLDYDFIKDFYNLAFIIDYGLIGYDNFNFVTATACEYERNEPGSGVTYLQKMNRSDSEIESFKNHPLISHRVASQYEEKFTYPELIEFVSLHHEKANGSGFPKGHKYAAMTDTETMLSFSDYMVPFNEHIFLKGDGNKVLHEYFVQLKELKNNEILPIKKLIARWESVMEWAKKDIEVAS